MLECKLQVSQKMRYETDLREIESIAREQLDSCEKHPIPRPADEASDMDFVYYIAFDAYIRAEVSILLG